MRFATYTDLLILIATTYREMLERAVMNRKICEETRNKITCKTSFLEDEKEINYWLLTKLIVKALFLEGDAGYFRRRFVDAGYFQNAQIGSSISDCTTGQYEGYGIYNKNAICAWKYQVIFDSVFWIEN